MSCPPYNVAGIVRSTVQGHIGKTHDISALGLLEQLLKGGYGFLIERSANSMKGSTHVVIVIRSGAHDWSLFPGLVTFYPRCLALSGLPYGLVGTRHYRFVLL